MSFFGSATPANTAAKPASLFTPFGAGATTTPAFGTAAPPFGNTSFGAPTATTAPTLTGFGGFGAAATSAPAPTLGGGFGGFGTSTATTSAPSLFSGFGATATTSTAPTFGGFGTQPSGFGGFGTTTGFGTSTFGKPAISTVTPGFGGFGGATNFMLGQPQQQIPQITPEEAFSQSINNVSIYGDERDIIIAKWNYLQALWGTGKSFYSQTAAPVEITPQNDLCRFKAMSYSRLPGKENKMGLVSLTFQKPLADVKAQQQQLVSALNGVFGNKPNLVVNIESSKEHEPKKCQFVIYVEEKLQIPPNESKRILATEVANYLNQVNVRPQLNNLGIQEALALVTPDEDQLNEYLENAPKGIDPRMWRQAKLDNPDPSKYIPVPMIGFNDLKWRIKCQENETETHALYLKKVERELGEIRQKHSTATARIMEYKRKLAELSHKLLNIIVKQECTRKVGLALTPDEEALRTKLENMQAVVCAPTQFKGRLGELLSQMRMQRNQYALTGGREYALDKDSEEEMMTFLDMQQKAIEVLADTVHKDMKALQIILDGMPELVRS